MKHFAVNLLTARDFERAFDECLNSYVSKEVARKPLLYRTVGQEERDEFLRLILDVIFCDSHAHAGRKRIGAWENGWSEHLGQITDPFDPSVLIPRYFGKYPVVRWRGEFVAPMCEGFEYRCLEILQHWVFDKYFRDVPSITEFGCGTGHNLIRAHKVNPKAWVHGLDWSETSQKIMRRLDHFAFDGRSRAHYFDFCNPIEYLPVRGSGVFTCAALEQVGEGTVGEGFVPFIEFLEKQKPAVCVHIEPINELLDKSKLLDVLSIRYARQREYLDGFLGYLRRMESDGRIEILMAKRTGIGSLFIDGYSVVAWRPK